MNDHRRELLDLTAQRAARLEAAEAALTAGDRESYESAMAEVAAFNDRIEPIQALLREQDRQALYAPGPSGAEARDMAEERGEALRKGEAVAFTAAETRRAVMEAVTLANGTLVQPTGAGANIRDPLGNVSSSIVDQVYVQDLTGMGAFLEPYVISELDARGGKPSTLAGKARTESTAPVFGVAKLSPYELNVTQYVDRNIARLSPADYYAKIYGMAMRAMRRKLAELIVNGDGQASPDMYGIKNARNTAGAAICASLDVEGIDESLLDSLFFAYGSDEAIGQSARLYLNKKDLAAIGKLRNGDKERVFKIRPDGGDPNSGTIEDSGTIVPYTVVSALTALSEADSSKAPVQTMLYGDPRNYELGLFGDYSIRVDESIKGVERMVTILGDAMVGGNLIVDKGFVAAAKPKSAS